MSIFDSVKKLFGSDIGSLINETYALENKFKDIKAKLVFKLTDVRKTLKDKLDKHNVELAKLKAEYEKKIADEGKKYETNPVLGDNDIVELEKAVKYIDKVLSHFDAIQEETE